MPIGRFLGGVAALVWSPARGKYLLLRRSIGRDFAGGAWECVTGRVDQGEGFEDALHREVEEELGIDVKVEFLVGTTHFFRGAPDPENELIGIVACCSLENPAVIRLSPEHSEQRWVSYQEAVELLANRSPTDAWLLRVIERTETIRQYMPFELRQYFRQYSFETG